MGRIIGRLILTLCCTILLAATVHAKTIKKVYLRDGGTIECQKAWQADGKVMVLVNRDTLVDLASREVDLKKTFARKPSVRLKKKAMTAQQQKAAVVQKVAAPSPPVKPEPAKAPPVKSEAAAKPVAKPAPPAAKPAPAVKQQAAEKPKPAPPAIKPSAAAKPKAVVAGGAVKAVQQSASSAKMPAKAEAKGKQPRKNLSLAQKTAPQEKKPLLGGNMSIVLLGALLVLLVIAYLVYKKKQQK